MPMYKINKKSLQMFWYFSCIFAHTTLKLFIYFLKHTFLISLSVIKRLFNSLKIFLAEKIDEKKFLKPLKYKLEDNQFSEERLSTIEEKIEKINEKIEIINNKSELKSKLYSKKNQKNVLEGKIIEKTYQSELEMGYKDYKFDNENKCLLSLKNKDLEENFSKQDFLKNLEHFKEKMVLNDEICGKITKSLIKKKKYFEVELNSSTIFSCERRIVTPTEPVLIFNLLTVLYPLRPLQIKTFKNVLSEFLIKKRRNGQEIVEKIIDKITEYENIQILNQLRNENFHVKISDYVSEVESKTFLETEFSINSQIIRLLRGVKHKKIIFSTLSKDVTNKIIERAMLSNYIDCVFSLDFSQTDLLYTSYYRAIELIGIILGNKNIHYFDSTEYFINEAFRMKWYTYNCTNITVSEKVESVCRFIDCFNRR